MNKDVGRRKIADHRLCLSMSKNEDMYDIRSAFSLKSLTNYDMKLYEAVCVLTSK